MQISDLSFGIALSITLMTVISASCPRSLTCPCGNTTDAVYYTHCVNETNEEKYSCKTWADCKTCEANTTRCLTCHSGRSGPTCAEDAGKSNGTTNRQEILFGSCSPLKDPLLGKAVCLNKTHDIRECTASCIPGFYFERLKNINFITLKCHDKIWTPLQAFPECRPGPRCTLRVRGNGYFHCTSDRDGAHCDVTCDDKFQGQYHCNLRQWRPSLPHCVVPADEKIVGLCLDPGKPEGVIRRHADGTAADNSRSFEEGESVRFLCKKKKHTFHGNHFITCKSDGTWSGELPHCTNTSSSELDSSYSHAAVQFPEAVGLTVLIWIVVFLYVKVPVFL